VPLRLRLALFLAIATGCVVLAGGWLFAHRLQANLLHGVDTNLSARADNIRSALASPGGEPTGLLEASRGTPFRSGSSAAQILDEHGAVISSTAAGSEPLVSPTQAATATAGGVYRSSSHKSDEGDRFLLVSVTHGGRRLVVVVRAGLDSTDDAIDRVKWQLAVAGGPIVVLAGAAGWWLAGAALRPVERMRRQVADLTEDDLGPGIDVPGTHDEVARLARTMNDLLARVRRARRRERGFVAEAGHELRTPLAILRGELELASRPGRSPEELRAALVVAAEETDRLSRLAEDLLLLARSDEGAMPLHLEATDVADLVGRSLSAAESRAADRGVRLAVDDRGAGPVDLDADRYRQAIDNLVDNAIRHAPRGSTVTARLERDGNELRCSLLDSGPGFPPQFLAQALDRFAKADDQREGSGAGLGLAIVQTIARAHGGRAWVSNRPEGGAEATISVALDHLVPDT
jgi:two-component system OmpR family sensor kinase